MHQSESGLMSKASAGVAAQHVAIMAKFLFFFKFPQQCIRHITDCSKFSPVESNAIFKYIQRFYQTQFCRIMKGTAKILRMVAIGEAHALELRVCKFTDQLWSYQPGYWPIMILSAKCQWKPIEHKNCRGSQSSASHCKLLWRRRTKQTQHWSKSLRINRYWVNNLMRRSSLPFQSKH